MSEEKDLNLKIIRTLFDEDLKEDDLQPYDSFFKFYGREIESFNKNLRELNEKWKTQAATSRESDEPALTIKSELIFKIVQVLKHSSSKTRNDVVKEIESAKWWNSQGTYPINESIDLAVRLWLMINLRTSRRTLVPYTLALQWDRDETLSDFIQHLFPQTDEPMTSNASHRVDADFTAVSLQQYRGTEITWTTSLEDHLRMKYNRKDRTAKLRVFPYKKILWDHLRSKDSPHCKYLLREAIWTLDLLFPVGDADTVKFLTTDNMLQYLHNVDFPETAPPGFYRYSHWKARLVELHDEFHAPANKLWMALKDQRNTVLWWTFSLGFVIAFMTAVFGVVTCVLAGLTFAKT